MPTGTVKWWNDAKGFGYITPDDCGCDDVFVHFSGVYMHGQQTLHEGQKVTFETVCGPRGKQAISVTPC